MQFFDKQDSFAFLILELNQETRKIALSVFEVQTEVFNTIQFIVRTGGFFLLYCSYCNIKRKA